jgi:hypothetical protein
MKRRDDFLDSRINETAIALYKRGCQLLREGVSPSSRAVIDCAYDLNYALQFRPWHEVLLDLEAYDIPPEELATEKWRVQVELRRQLAETV